ncbi:MAG TPA: diaminopimelate epimerase [Gemmatimonadota bacterium]|nr:diaminopimelate epimerase [Gemmatimonadota bacterium]
MRTSLGTEVLSGRPFVKMSGGGNDFVVFDNRDGWFPKDRALELVARVCRRGLGVGVDAVLLLEKDAEADIRMVYYNADGGEAPMCGNGALCIARYARMEGEADADLRLATGSGTFRARVPDPERPEVTLWLVPPHGLALGHPDLEKLPYRRVGFVDTSTPHVVALVDDVENHDVIGEGRRLRRDPRWDPPGANANFVTVLDRRTIRMRTYERGVEDETLSCGTGATASAILTALWGLTEPPVTVRTTGGIPLVVDFTRPEDRETLPEDPRLTGDARVVFRGILDEV